MTKAERQRERTAGAMALRAGLWALLLFWLAMAFPAVATACSADFDTRDDRLAVAKDGSFKNANIFTPRGEFFPNGQLWIDYASGNPVRNIGDGRVAQLITFSSQACSGSEALLFVDCNRRESILIYGEPPPPDPSGVGIAGWSWSYISYIQPPHGPIGVTKASTVESLAKVAGRNRIGYELDADGKFSGVRKRDHYDVYLGCKLYYPGSPGAGG